MRKKKALRRYRPRYMRTPGTGKGKIAAVSVIVCLAAILSAVTMAWLMDKAEVKNTFTPASVDCEVRETFDGSEKTDVTVENTGSTGAYIRAIMVVNWVGDEGTENAGKISATVPVAGTDYTVSYGIGWALHSDGFYYYTQSVAAGQSTGVLLESCAPVGEGPAGCHMEVEIVAEAVQSTGTDSSGTKAVLLAWGVDPEKLTEEAVT